MLFKQVKLFKLSGASCPTAEKLAEKLDALTFRACPASMPQSMGWVSPVEEDGAPLVHVVNASMMICLQVEEKILPAMVIRQELAKKVKQIEDSENKKVYSKQKNNLKDEIVMTLLPRAFSKISRVYAYIDSKNKYLVLGTTNEKKIELFISLLKKSVGDDIEAVVVDNLSSTLTHWLQNKSYPSSFSIEKACVLQDPNQETRVIRCQQQDLFASSIQSLVKDGCKVKQIALEWHDHIVFNLLDNFAIQSIRFQEQVIGQVEEMEAATRLQQFNADFYMMTETLSALIKELLAIVGQAADNVVPMDKAG